MASRRAPLSNLPNAANSPFHAAATAAQKRPRTTSDLKHELLQSREPPIKRQVIDQRRLHVDSPAKRGSVQIYEDKSTANSGALLQQHQQLQQHRNSQLSARSQQPQVPSQQQAQQVRPERLSITEWQSHYLRLFPRFVFYFDGISEEQRGRRVKQVIKLGAQCATFFSSAVTHVITAREPSIPEEPEVDKENFAASEQQHSRQVEEQGGSIDVAGKTRLDQYASNGSRLRPPRGAFTFEAPAAGKASQSRQAPQSTVVSQAQKLGKKVWPLHKLVKILEAILNIDRYGNPTIHHHTRTAAQQAKHPEEELQSLLRHEKLHGPADRDRNVPVREEVPFVGHYFVINDMNSQYKPIMMREYPKPTGSASDGEWPQFRTSTQGRSPFLIDESALRKRQKAEEIAMAMRQSCQPVTRSRAALAEKSAMNPPQQRSRTTSIHDQTTMRQAAQSNGHSRETSLNSGNFLPAINRTSSANTGSCGHFRDISSRRGMWEPAASGVQPSNVTSAIRSQSISSAAVIPGPRAATSKDLYDLKRRAFENNSAPRRLTHSQAMSNLCAVAEGQEPPAPVRPPKRKIEEHLDVLDEEETSVIDPAAIEQVTEGTRDEAEDEELRRQAEAARASRHQAMQTKKPRVLEQQQPPQQQPVEKVKKPGYCENCRDKYEDFDEHVLGNRHRRFAVNEQNWADLDQLLVLVQRPVREQYTGWGC